MVLTKEELIGLLQNEVRILLHLAGKIDDKALNYKPTEKQRTSLELLQYLNCMGPALVRAIQAGSFDVEAWGAATAASAKLDLAGVTAAIGKQAEIYPQLLGGWTEADFRGEIEMFGTKTSRGALLVNMVLGGHAAYRTQLFLYLKSCGQESLSTMNLWGGVDPA